MRTVLFSDLLDPIPATCRLGLVFSPADRQRLVEALDHPGEPSLVLEQLRQQLAGERQRYSPAACHAENQRLLAARRP